MYLQREQYLESHPQLRKGIVVYSLDGERLGDVYELCDDHFVIEKGFFFPRHFTARYDDLAHVSDDRAELRLTKAQLSPWREDAFGGWARLEREAMVYDGDRDVNEIRVPVVEEELEARKTERKAGEVRLRKTVHTEVQHLSVPVTREEVFVERVPADGKTPSAAEFREDTIAVPVMEEEVEIVKRPVVREEVRLRKEKITERRELEGRIQKEEVEIDRDGTGSETEQRQRTPKAS